MEALDVEVVGPSRAEIAAQLADGRRVILEGVRPRGRGPEARALADQWIAEARGLARSLRRSA